VQLTGVYMFFTMMMFGAIYFIVPRITGCEWLCGKRIRRHFWLNAYACIFMCVLLLVCGFSQGAAIDNWDSDYESAITFSQGYLVGMMLLWICVVAGNLGFALHLLAMVSNRGRKAGAATLIHSPQTPYDAAEIMITTEGAEA
jgi:cytochrome c oxidase cbb3-type subunit I